MFSKNWILKAVPIFLILTVASVWSQTERKAEDQAAGLALKTTRTIEFPTDEGTWMSVDVSPDGRQVVFDLLGDLYTLPMSGGEARRITSGPAWDTQPRFSPDGNWIAFVSDRNGTDNLWVIRPDGTEPRVVTRDRKNLAGSPSWSPDGNYLAVRRGESSLDLNELWLYHKDGGTGIQLTKRDGATKGVASPTFSPDGKYIYFSGSTQGHAYNSNLGHFQVRRINRETGQVETLTGPYGGGLRPLLSPNGRYLVYGTRYDGKTGLKIRAVDGGAERWLVYPIDRDEQEGFYCADVMPGYAFTPDGGSVVISYGGKIHKIDIEGHRDTLIPFTAQVRQEVAPRVFFPRKVAEGPVSIKQMRWPNKSSDGKKLVFGAVGKVWVMDLPNGTPRRLTQGTEREYAPSFSPDGRWIAYVTWSDDGGGHVWKIASEGGSSQMLTQVPAYYHMPAWSPDGSKIAYVTGSAEAWLDQEGTDQQEIRWVPAAGGESHHIVDSPLPSPAGGGRGAGTVQHPTFSADGQRVYYLDSEAPPSGLRATPGSVNVLSVRLDGSEKRTHIKLRAGTQAIVSPNESWVAFTVRGNGYMVAMPHSNDATIVDLDASPLPLKTLTNEGAEDLRWEEGGKTITWGFTNHYYRVGADEALRSTKPEDLKPATVAINLQLPRHTPQGKVALRNARIITMHGDEIIARGDVIVENNRIASVGPSGKVTIPRDATTFDLNGKTVMPGILDLHDHVHPIREIIPQRSPSLAAHLAYGVTFSFDPSADNDAIFGAGEMVETGDLLGSRIYSTGAALNTRAAKIDSLEDARHIVRRYREMGAITLKEYLQPRRIQRQWIMMAAQEENLNVTADGGGHLAFDMTHALDGFTGFEHTMPVVPLYKDVIEFLARSKTYYSPTLIVELVGPWGEDYFRQSTDLHADQKLLRFTPHEEIDRKTRRRLLVLDDDYRIVPASQAVANVVHKGGYAVTGGHGEQEGLGTHWEIWLFAMGGLTPMETLRSATIMGAECIGMGADLGSIEAGKLADLIVLNSNPLDNIRNTTDILYVMKNGEMFEGGTLNQVWPEKKPFEKFYWQKNAPPVTRTP
jgi:Tol biopolymer transport system component/imidazolonepropionase-like amidohydrolase